MPPRFDPRKLTRAQQGQRIAAANAKAAMRRDGLSLRRAAAQYHVSGRSILRWFPGSIGRDARGHFVALPDDEVFVMAVVTTEGMLELDVHGSTAREALSRHYEAIRRLLDPDIGDSSGLLALRGTRIAGHELETDPDAIEELFFAGELDVVTIYLLDT